MIITKNIEIEINIRNLKKLTSLYHLVSPRIGDIIVVPIENISNGSNSIIEVSCDYCNNILKVPLKRYNKSIKIVNKYSCSKKICSNQKIKDVCLFKYGVENPFQSEDINAKQTFGETVKILRESNNLTLREVSNNLDIDARKN
jgi:hypothetical protein